MMNIKRLLNTVLLLLLCHSVNAGVQGSPTVIEKEIVSDISRIAVSYNDRICPIQTVALDFVSKLTGQSSWQGYSAEEIFVGWMIYYTEWETQKLIHVESPDVQHILGIEGEWASVRDFYTSRHEYKLSGLDADSTLSSEQRDAIAEVDMKMQLVTMFYHSEMLRMFPLTVDGQTDWYTPGSTELPLGTPNAEFQFINHAMDHLTQAILANDIAGARNIISKIRLYQEEKAAQVLPSHLAITAEVLHNKLLTSCWWVYLCLLLSVLFAITAVMGKQGKWMSLSHTVFLAALFTLLTLVMGMRWWVSGHVPLSNDYETLLSMAWVSSLIGIICMRRYAILKALAPVLTSLCLFFTAYTVSSPLITALMPVLQTPLLFVHVVFVVISYSLFAIIFLISAYGLFLRSRGKVSESLHLVSISYRLLWPAVGALVMGILIGSVWAKIAWGSYWMWDPKETWALITLIIYMIPLYRPFRNFFPHWHQLYLLIAFLAVLMTYFGVNYFMPGMHSYA